jgi:hypothetical protein
MFASASERSAYPNFPGSLNLPGPALVGENKDRRAVGDPETSPANRCLLAISKAIIATSQGFSGFVGMRTRETTG